MYFGITVQYKQFALKNVAYGVFFLQLAVLFYLLSISHSTLIFLSAIVSFPFQHTYLFCFVVILTSSRLVICTYGANIRIELRVINIIYRFSDLCRVLSERKKSFFFCFIAKSVRQNDILCQYSFPMAILILCEKLCMKKVFFQNQTKICMEQCEPNNWKNINNGQNDLYLCRCRKWL